jgi:hypothetical protein
MLQCGICTQYSEDTGAATLGSKWVGEGCVVTSANDLAKHASTGKVHSKAVEHAATKLGQRGIRGAMERAAQAAQQQVRGIAPTLILLARFIIAENLPARKFSRLVVHDALMQGTLGLHCELTQKYNAVLLGTSGCLFACSEVKYLAQQAALVVSPCWSLLIDSSSDVAGEDHLLVYARYFTDREAWEVATKFVCCVKLSAGGPDHVTFAVVLGAIDALKLPMSKLVGVCTDGCSCMCGRINGFTTPRCPSSLRFTASRIAVPWCWLVSQLIFLSLSR